MPINLAIIGARPLVDALLNPATSAHISLVAKAAGVVVWTGKVARASREGTSLVVRGYAPFSLAPFSVTGLVIEIGPLSLRCGITESDIVFVSAAPAAPGYYLDFSFQLSADYASTPPSASSAQNSLETRITALEAFLGSLSWSTAIAGEAAAREAGDLAVQQAIDVEVYERGVREPVIKAEAVTQAKSETIAEVESTKGQPGGIAPLDGDGKVPAANLPAMSSPAADEAVAGIMKAASAAVLRAGTATDAAPTAASLKAWADTEVVRRESANSIIFNPGPDPTANGTGLQSAYAKAAALTPNGVALSATNRAVLYCLAGKCATTLTLIQFVDLVGVGSEGSVIIDGLTTSAPGGFQVNVRVENLTVPAGIALDPGAAHAFCIFRKLNPGTVTGSGSVGRWEDVICYGTFFANTSTAGIFRRVVGGGNYSFSGGVGAVFSGVADECVAGHYSFGGIAGTFSGTATRCTAGEYAFGGNGVFSGTATDCTAGGSSFGANGTFSGTATRCTGGFSAFGGNAGPGSSFTGTTIDCIGGDNSFGGTGNFYGTARGCKGGHSSFGGGLGAIFADGAITEDCKGGNDSFGGGGGTFGGLAINCVGLSFAFGGTEGILSGLAIRCTGGSGSFEAYDGTGGRLIECRQTDLGYFPSEGNTIVRNCLGNDNAYTNQN